MAGNRNRDRARERQARRKAERSAPVDDPRELIREEFEAGAPRSDLGQSESVVGYDDSDSSHLGDGFDPELDDPEEELFEVVSARDSAEADDDTGLAQHAHRPRFVQFLLAVRAELSRVQWPDRQTLTTLTGVVLGFVIIAGGYLGLLDAVFSRLIQAIL